jgi:mevalonate kinase
VNSTQFYSNGKLLLTGEYVVLDGALSLALPTQYGQSLEVKPIMASKLIWQSFDENGDIWFENTFELDTIEILKQVQHDEISKQLIQILKAAKQLNPSFLISENGFKISCELSFNKDWGLGTSSTLINNIAQWAKIDPYKLLELSFGGSGYDIACAQHNSAITYQLNNNNMSVVKEIDFNPLFKECLYFLYLNKKQNSRDAILDYRSNSSNFTHNISEISEITLKIIACKSLTTFESLINQHESIISKLIKQQPIKELLFNDFHGSIKSLGAWGGDFVLVTSKQNPSDYFKEKGFDTLIPYNQMILK